MLDLRKTIENVCHAAPDKESTAQNREQGEEEPDLSLETRTRVKTALTPPRKLKKPRKSKKPKIASQILRNFSLEFEGQDAKIIRSLANRTARFQDFDILKLKKKHKTGTKKLQDILKNLFDRLEMLGLSKMQTTELKKDGREHLNHYLIVKPIGNPSYEPRETDQNKVEQDKTPYQITIKNLDFIPSKSHHVLLFLALSSKYHNWADYNKISLETGQNQKSIIPQIQALKRMLPKIGLELLEEKTKKGKRYFHLAILGEDKEERNNFHTREQKKQLLVDQKTKPCRLPNAQTMSTSKVILQQWPKRQPEEEWYETDPQPKHRLRWSDTTSGEARSS